MSRRDYWTTIIGNLGGWVVCTLIVIFGDSSESRLLAVVLGWVTLDTAILTYKGYRDSYELRPDDARPDAESI